MSLKEVGAAGTNLVYSPLPTDNCAAMKGKLNMRQVVELQQEKQSRMSSLNFYDLASKVTLYIPVGILLGVGCLLLETPSEDSNAMAGVRELMTTTVAVLAIQRFLAFGRETHAGAIAKIANELEKNGILANNHFEENALQKFSAYNANRYYIGGTLQA